MSLGVRYQLPPVIKGDSAEIYAALREREGVVGQDEISGVQFVIQQPNGVFQNPVDGEVEPDGQGYVRFEETEETGEYIVQAKFQLLSGEVRSVMVNFAVYDPFDNSPKSPEEIVAEDVWMRLEDAYDSFNGGPVLREFTLSHFDEKKILRFIPEALLDINVQMPLTEAGIGEFASSPTNPNLPLLAKGVLCKVIMHLSRSYAEQPIIQGGQALYEGREHYVKIWQELYKTEHEDYYTMVRLWKRGFLNYGKSALLVSSKAGRLFYSGQMMRSRNVGRGFY